MFTDSANQMVSGANLMLLTNTIGYFADHDISVSIPVKSYEVSTLIISQSSIYLISSITTIILPLLLLACGFIIWLKRRKQ